MTVTDEKLAELRALRNKCIHIPRRRQTPYINALEDAAPALLDEIERLRASEKQLLQDLAKSGGDKDYDRVCSDRDRYRDIAVRLAKQAEDACINYSMGWDDSGAPEKLAMTLQDPDIAALLKETEHG